MIDWRHWHNEPWLIGGLVALGWLWAVLAGPLRARVTYGGYADELMTLNDGAAASTVNLANATVIVVARKQRLKVYLKTARKQVRRSLRQVRN